MILEKEHYNGLNKINKELIKKKSKKESWIKKEIIKFLTPENTEEIKSGLFIKRIRGESIFSRLDKKVKGHDRYIKYDKYAEVYPVAWNGKIIARKINLLLGARPIVSTIYFLSILLICYGYIQNNQVQGEFYNQVIFNQTLVQYLCNQNIQNNLTQIYELNVTELCIKRIIVNNETTNINLGDLNWSIK